MGDTFKAHLALIGANLIYALNYGLAKDVMGDGYLLPFVFILFRAVGACLLFWGISFISKKEKVARKDFITLAICGVFGVAANQLMFFEGLSMTSEISAAIIMTTNPILVLLMAAIFLKEKLRLPRIIGIILGFSGAAYLILSKNIDGAKASSALGDLFIFLNAASYGVYLILVTPLMKKYSPFTVIKWVFTFGLLFVIPFSLHQIEYINWDMPTDIILKIGFVIIFTTFFAYVFNIYALRKVSPTVVSTYIYLQPLLTTLIAIFFRDSDDLTMDKVISAVLIFGGVYLVSKKAKVRPQVGKSA